MNTRTWIRLNGFVWAMISVAAVARAEDDWPLFRGDAVSSGVARGSLPDKLDVLWKFEVKGGAFDATPAIVGGVVYLGDADGRLYALDLKTGDKKWERKLEAGFIAAPAVRNGLLYIGDMDGKFFCFDTDTGQPRWDFATQAEIDSSANFYKDQVLVGSQDATLYCLNARDGKLAWKFSIADQIRCSPTIVENRCFVAGCDSRLHVIDLDKGAEIAAVEIEAPTGVTPAVLGDIAYFGTEAGAFFAVNWRAAKVEWVFKPDQGSQPFRSSPAVTPDVVVFGGRNKRVHALNPKNGDVLWEFAAKNRVDGSPVIVGQRAIVGSADGRLYALDLRTGDKVWEFEAGGGFSTFRVPTVTACYALIMSEIPRVFAKLRWGFIETSSQWVPWVVHEAVRRSSPAGMPVGLRDATRPTWVCSSMTW